MIRSIHLIIDTYFHCKINCVCKNHTKISKFFAKDQNTLIEQSICKSRKYLLEHFYTKIFYTNFLNKHEANCGTNLLDFKLIIVRI